MTEKLRKTLQQS